MFTMTEHNGQTACSPRQSTMDRLHVPYTSVQRTDHMFPISVCNGHTACSPYQHTMDIRHIPNNTWNYHYANWVVMKRLTPQPGSKTSAQHKSGSNSSMGHSSLTQLWPCARWDPPSPSAKQPPQNTSLIKRAWETQQASVICGMTGPWSAEMNLSQLPVQCNG